MPYRRHRHRQNHFWTIVVDAPSSRAPKGDKEEGNKENNNKKKKRILSAT